jgi:hypothetical protein
MRFLSSVAGNFMLGQSILKECRQRFNMCSEQKAHLKTLHTEQMR